MIVQHLRAIQNRFGYLPDVELLRLAHESGVAPAQIEEVASFYASFRQERDRPAVVEVRVCRDMTCHLRGASRLLAGDGLPLLSNDAELLKSLAENVPKWAGAAGQPAPPGDRCRVAVEGVSCLGRCDRAPAVWIERHPMPDGEHARVYACKQGESFAEFRM